MATAPIMQQIKTNYVSDQSDVKRLPAGPKLELVPPSHPQKTEFKSARPSKLRFGGYLHPELRLSKALPVHVSVVDSQVVATWPEVDVFGYGDSLSAALEDFGHTVGELFLRLDREESLSAHLQKTRSRLSQYIHKR